MLSATPSGGWLQSSPVIPALGWPLGTRAQMFWLEEGLPSSLEPGKRPRTTLSPGLALRDGAGRISRGARLAGTSRSSGRCMPSSVTSTSGLNLQAAIEAPEFHTDHLISSFFPRGFAPKSPAVESRFDARTIADLQRRGHDVSVGPAWSAGTRLGRRARARGSPPGGGEPARDAGLRGRPMSERTRTTAGTTRWRCGTRWPVAPGSSSCS